MQAPEQQITTPSLVLVPIDLAVARGVIDGDPDALSAAGLRPGAGWPHRDSLDGLRIAVDNAGDPGWFVTADGDVIGECGTKGPPDRDGRVEIGYGLAAPFRGRGLGRELVAGLTGWLLARADVAGVVAEVLADNLPSRRSLERARFEIERLDPPYVWYATAKKV